MTKPQKQRQKEQEGFGHITHGMSKTPIYKSWESMKQRCLNKNHWAYHYYGGRGVTVCERWKQFAQFHKDMGSSHFMGATIDRINNDGGYCPENCRWATRRMQISNQSKTLKFQFNNEELTLRDLSERTNVNYYTLLTRLVTNKVPIEIAVLPVGQYKMRLNSFLQAQ